MVNWTVDHLVELREYVPSFLNAPLHKLGIPDSWIPKRYETQYEVYMNDETENPEESWEYKKPEKKREEENSSE